MIGIPYVAYKDFSLTIAAAELDFGSDLTTGALTITAKTDTAPTVTTKDASDINSTSATLNGEVSDDGEATITGYGFYYSKDHSSQSDLVASGTKVENAGSATDFTKSLSSLVSGTTYYYIAYATNAMGTSYGGVKSFETVPTYTATVNTCTDGSPAAAPGAVELRQGGTTVYTAAVITTGVYATDAAVGTYDVYVNGEDTGTDIEIDGAAASVDIEYYTVAFTAADAGTASGSTISADADGTSISSGDAALSGKEVIITAAGAGADTYTYAWTGTGTNGETTEALTIDSLSGAVDATCTVTGTTSAGYYTPNKTITVTETSSELFKNGEGEVKAEANMGGAFSDSVEVKVTDTEEDAANFGFGIGNTVYPFDISLYIKGTDTKTEPAAGYAVTISLSVPDELLDVKEQLSIAHKSDDGTAMTLSSRLTQINGVWYLVFEATEFSPYALVASDAASFDEADGLPYYLDTEENAVFIGFAADGKYIAPDGVTVLLKENPKSFADVSGHWAADYIDFVTERELFAGTGNNKFSPDIGMTRAMFATVIGRLYERSYGEIAAAGEHAFTDCDYEQWYGKYVGWAADNGIISGYGNGKFGPGDEITREGMAAILYRFAEFLKITSGDTGTKLTYPDAGDISSWARYAALYCQKTGIITGRDGGNFVPQGTATRAEVAAILERFIEHVLD